MNAVAVLNIEEVSSNIEGSKLMRVNEKGFHEETLY